MLPMPDEDLRMIRKQWNRLRPVPLGLRPSVGFGDRLGLATPGHIRAARRCPDIAPLFAQQSVRENARTGRTPQQVLDDALLAVYRVGWKAPWGADADHLKTPEEIGPFVAAGYTFYTVDPGDHVDDTAYTASPTEIEARLAALPWDTLEDTRRDLERRYLARPFDLGEFTITFDRETLARAAVKYGRAVAHTARMYRHLAALLDERAFELEISVDETATPTSPEEHLFIANELRRLGVHWISLAPRYVGRFEKGVDYIGDLKAFEAQLARHVAIARAWGPYKLSLHSGSDKFSIYPIVARLTGGLVHLKTAGTSYLEALRVVAQKEPPLFREILTLACERYERDRVTYHVSADPGRLPRAEDLSDDELPHLLEQNDARQILHVTFGSVLERLGDRLKETVRHHQETYHTLLESHFERHLRPFCNAGRSDPATTEASNGQRIP